MAREDAIRQARQAMERRIREHGEKTGQRLSTREAETRASEIARRVERRESEKK